MKILLYLKEVGTFLEDGSVPWQVWGDELQATWFKKALVRKGHQVEIRSFNQPLADSYDAVVFFHPGHPQVNADKKIFWFQGPCGFDAHEFKKRYDLILSSSISVCDGRRIIFFPPAVDLEERFRVDEPKVKSDVVFIGNYAVRTQDCYEKYLDPIVDLGVDLKIYGNGGQAWGTTKYAQFYQGRLEMSEKVCEVISGSKIMLDIHQNFHRETNMMTGRCLEGMACGSLVVSDRLPVMEHCFVKPDGAGVDVCVVLVDGGQDTSDKVRWLLGDGVEMLELIQRANEMVKEHTWDVRVDKLFKFL